VRGLLQTAGLQLRVAKRLAPRRGASFGERLGRLDDRFVFVVGSPRSGTTFLASAIGSAPGFVDLGEVAPLKSAVPELVAASPAEASRRLRRILAVARRVGLVGSVRAVEQTPEMAFLIDVARIAYPQARFVHIVRDGRDVVSSLLEKQWLKPTTTGSDDAGLPYGAYARFWVGPERRAEFAEVSDARRAAWAWRRYVAAARNASGQVLELRYEDVTRDAAASASALGLHLDAPAHAIEEALEAAHDTSVGRYRNDLSEQQLADVMAEAGDVLRDLGYLSSARA
jgi:Sulfotransferase family